MFAGQGLSVARVALTPRFYWRVCGYDGSAVLLRATLHRSLTEAYRQRASLLKDCAYVVVEGVPVEEGL